MIWPKPPSLHEHGAVHTQDRHDDRSLIDRIQAGDVSAFDPLVRRHADAIYRLSLRLTGHREEAEDIAQETFARGLRKISAFRHESAFRTWLFRIAVNLHRDALRRRNASPISNVREDEVIAEPATTDEEPRRRAQFVETSSTVRQLIDRLPEMQHEAIVLRVYEDLPYEEIAEILQTSIGAVKMNLVYARRKLAAWLADRGDAS